MVWYSKKWYGIFDFDSPASRRQLDSPWSALDVAKSATKMANRQRFAVKTAQKRPKFLRLAALAGSPLRQSYISCRPQASRQNFASTFLGFRDFWCCKPAASQVVFIPPKSGKYHFLIPRPLSALIPQDPHTGNV